MGVDIGVDITGYISGTFIFGRLITSRLPDEAVEESSILSLSLDGDMSGVRGVQVLGSREFIRTEQKNYGGTVRYI